MQLFAVKDNWNAIQHVASHPIFQAHCGGGVFASRITTLALQYNACGQCKNRFDSQLTELARNQLVRVQAGLETSPAEFASSQAQLVVEERRDLVAATNADLVEATKEQKKVNKLLAAA